MIETNMNSPSRTPTTSPPKKTMRITQIQKQALIDNLQLEITERARKLRAQYAQQAASLRSRLEIRLHRIPTSLRKANMGELLAKYNATLENKKAAAPPTTVPPPTKRMEDKPVTQTTAGSPAQTRGMKRKRSASRPAQTPKPRRAGVSAAKTDRSNSEHFDKENIPTSTAPYAALPNPKKRSKPNPAPAPAATVAAPPAPAKRTTSRTAPPRTKQPTPAPATRTASRALARATSRSKAPPPPPSTILSPKSSNVQAPAPTVKKGKAAAAPAPKKGQAPPSAPVKAAGKRAAPRVQAEAPAGGRRVLRTRK